MSIFYKIEVEKKTTKFSHIFLGLKFMSPKHEHEQGINEITFTKNGEMYIYEHGGLKLEKSNNNGYYTLESVANVIGKPYISILRFINTNRFSWCISCYDPSFEMWQYIYYIRFKKYIKIGRTYDLKKEICAKVFER